MPNFSAIIKVEEYLKKLLVLKLKDRSKAKINPLDLNL